jgi:hypothetical protein
MELTLLKFANFWPIVLINSKPFCSEEKNQEKIFQRGNWHHFIINLNDILIYLHTFFNYDHDFLKIEF